MKLEREIWKKNNIEMQAKLKKMEMILGEKEENIVMLNEELECYLKKYDEEKFHHNNISESDHKSLIVVQIVQLIFLLILLHVIQNHHIH